MAARTAFLEEELSCPVCCDIFRDPVLLSCSHSFCRLCLSNFWELRGSPVCPICKRTSPKIKPPSNLVLRNLCESYLSERSKFCSKHSERLRLFCLDDNEVVCVECLSDSHAKHCFCHVDKVTQERKGELRTALKPVQEKLKAFLEAKRNLSLTAEYIKTQARDAETKMRGVFASLHTFLRVEEAARIANLKEEEECKSQRVKEMLERIDPLVSKLSETVQALEQQLGVEAVPFLSSYEGLKERAQCTLSDPEPVSGVLIDVAKHLGNLKYRVWEAVLGRVDYIPMTFDPNTAHCSLLLSDDLTSVRHGHRQELPDTTERFDTYVWALGSKGFTSGRHQWDVEVGNKPSWMLGVATGSMERKGQFSVSPGEGLWVLWYKNGKYKTWTSLWKPLTVASNPQKIRVQLDWDAGEVSFLDASLSTPLFQLKYAFTEEVFPLFCPGSDSVPLRICPAAVSIE